MKNGSTGSSRPLLPTPISRDATGKKTIISVLLVEDSRLDILKLDSRRDKEKTRLHLQLKYFFLILVLILSKHLNIKNKKNKK